MRIRSGLRLRLRPRGAALVNLVLVAVLAVASTAGAETLREREIRALSYPVDGFDIEYALDHPEHPPLAELEALEVELRVTDGGLLPPHPTTRNVRFPLGRVPAGSRFYTDGLRHVASRILSVFAERGIDGVLVTLPDIEEGTGRDLRPAGDRTMHIRIWTGRVERVATVADGERFGDEDIEVRTNHPAHAFVREGSPVQAGGEKGLLRVGEIEDYAFRLSRHPGRSVDAILRPGELPGTTRVDYHVAEDKPWMLYAQASNTGTEATTRWRERFGFSTNQATGNDDILRFDYVTGNFDEVHGLWGLYEAPVWRLRRLRVAAAGSWSEYDASEVGVASVDAQGDQWEAGGRLYLELFQHRELFVDLFGGATWRNVTVDRVTTQGSSTVFDEGDADFFMPEGGLRVRRHTGISSLSLDLWADHNLSSVTGTDEDDLRALGTIEPDEDFTRARWEGALSIFLEPALRWRRFTDPSTPASSTLAHELLATTRGQYSFGDARLVPQLQQIAGGLYTVRGYDQAVTAGDSVAIGSLEYRLHLARLLDPGGEPVHVPVVGELNVRPEHVYGRPDWDLVLKAFVDAARVHIEDADQPGDQGRNETLLAVGLGAELHLLRYLSARVDLGWPQRKLEGEDVDRPEIHTAITLRF